MSAFDSLAASTVTPLVSINMPASPLSGVVGRFEMSRSLSGIALPQGMFRTGLSVGSASVEIDSDALTVTPWAAVNAVQANQRCRITATAPDGEVLDLGTWITGEHAASLTERGVKIELLEEQYAARQIPASLPATDLGSSSGMDSSWAVDLHARRAGYFSSPAMRSSAFLSMPFIGGWWPERWVNRYSGVKPTSFVTGGRYGVDGSGDMHAIYPTRAGAEPLLIDNISHYVSWIPTDDASSLVLRYKWNNGPTTPLADAVARITINHAARTFAVYSDDVDASGTGSFAHHTGAGNYNIFQLQVRRAGSGSGPLGHGTYGPLQVRGRCGTSAGDFGAWLTIPGTADSYPASWFMVAGPDAGFIRGMQLTNNPEDGLWSQPPRNSYIPPFGWMHGAYVTPPDSRGKPADTWSEIRDITGGFLASAVRQLDGTLRVMDRWRTAGGAAVKETIRLDDQAADLVWGLNPADVHDRLEIKFNPVTRLVSGGISDPGPPIIRARPIAWELDGPVSVAAGETVRVRANLDDPSWIIWGFLNGVLFPNIETTCTWEANAAPDGSSTQVTHLVVTGEQKTSTTAEVVIHNPGTYPVWMVDPSGKPHVRLRAEAIWKPREEVVARGVSESSATNVLTLSLPRHVQHPETVESIADWLWPKVSNARHVFTIPVVPNWRRELGDVVRLVHERSGLDMNAVIIDPDLKAEPGNVSQTITVAAVSS